MIICIGREFGSGGHEIGRIMSQNLGMAFYDQEILVKCMEKNPLIPLEEMQKADEKKVNPMIYSVYYEGTEKRLRSLSSNDITFRLQGRGIEELASQSNCIFVGRCADYILKQTGIPNLSLFICAPLGYRIERKMELFQKNERQAAALVNKMDKQRRNYYNYYTGGSWGHPYNYEQVAKRIANIRLTRACEAEGMGRLSDPGRLNHGMGRIRWKKREKKALPDC